MSWRNEIKRFRCFPDEEGLKLDIGCGNFPRGDVNVDLFLERGLYRTWKEQLRAKEISNFLNVDVHHLPFKDSVFDLVSSYQLLCHIRNPSKGLAEMIRVTKGKVVVTVPFFLFNTITMVFGGRKRGRHEQWFTPEWFKSRLENCSIRFKILFLWFNPHKYLWIKFPWIDMVVIWKRKVILKTKEYVDFEGQEVSK